MRVVIELKRGEVAEIVLNNLYAQTPMETVFGINMVALQDGQPKLLSLKEMLEAFIRHRREVVTRRTIHDLAKARERAHVLEGLAVALANIDDIIALIKAAPSPAAAREALQARPWPAGIVPELLARAGTMSTRPADSGRRPRPVGGGLPSLRGAGAGYSGHAPEPPDGARAGEDCQRVPRAAGANWRFGRHPGASGAAHAGGARGARRDSREVRRCAPYRDQPRSSGSDDRGSDRATGRGRNTFTRGLREIAAVDRISNTAPRRSRQSGDSRKG